MSQPRIVAIKCPSCKGTGKGPLRTCMWCDGVKKLRREAALKWADQSIVHADIG